jgi:hypothetical protein
MSEQSGVDQNNGNTDRKRCDIIAVPPTNGPCPHGLMAHMSLSSRLSLSGRRIDSPCSVRVLAIEINFEVEVLVAIFQNLGTIIRVNVVHVLPGIVLLRKPIPTNLKLESIPEPTSVDVLLHYPEVFVVDLDRWRSGFSAMQDCIRDRFREDVNMEYIMNLPFGG